MSKLKCIDCGQEFDAKFSSCPNCGCPSSSCQIIEEETAPKEETTYQGSSASEQRYAGQQQQSQQPYHQANPAYGEDVFPTTDTGVENERVIKNYANIIWMVSLALAGLAEVLSIIQVMSIISKYPRAAGMAFLSLIGVTLMLGLFLLAVYLLRAFIMVVHNISINVHEINMKVK